MLLKSALKLWLLSLLVFTSSHLIFAQQISYNLLSTLQLRHNASSDFYASDQLLVAPGSTETDIGIGIQGKRLLKPRGKFSIEAGIQFFRNTVSYTTFEVLSNNPPVEIVEFGKTRSNTNSTLSIPIRLFYNTNPEGKNDARDGVYIGPILNFERFRFDEEVIEGKSSRFSLDLQLGARTGKRKVYFDVSFLLQAYSSLQSDLLGANGISLSLGYRFR